jgi:quercetin dioxygenase-like cupin family protein
MHLRQLGFALALTCAVAAPAIAKDVAAPATYQNLLTPLLQTGADTIGQPIAYPPGTPKITAAIVTIPPGGETGWHSHEVPLMVYVLEGEVTVDYGEKGIKVYPAGSAAMEAMNWPHNGMNKGSAPLRLLAVYMGSDAKANTLTAEAPK